MTRTTIATGLVSALLLGACTIGAAEGTGGAEEDEQTDRFREVVCPADVDGEIVYDVTCGTLTVPEDRANATGATIELFVARVLPPDGPDHPDPIVVLGEIGGDLNFAGISPIAQRTEREAIFLEPRGGGHAEPRLDCPEISEVHDIYVRAGGVDGAEAFADAAAACADRLRRAGVELQGYDNANAAADVEDLRLALGIESWNLFSIGAGSLVGFEVLRTYGAGVRAAVFDSPSVPQVDPAEEAIRGTVDALGETADACTDDRACARAFPDLEDTVVRVLAQTAELGPWRVDGVTIGAPEIARLYRNAYSSGNLEGMSLLPLFTYAVVSEDRAATRAVNGALADTLATEPGWCIGYTEGSCDEIAGVAHGALLSEICRDREPFVDRDTVGAELPAEMQAEVHESFAVAFRDADPFLAACEVWGVAPAPPEIAEPVVSDVPVLLLTGRFSAFGPTFAAREAVQTLANGWVVEVPNSTSNPLGTGDDCVLGLRNAWLDAPTSPPDTTCLDELPPVTFPTEY